MINCDKIAKQAFKYLEGSLTESERNEIMAHLDSCQACMARLSLARQTLAALHRLPPRKISADFDIVLHARMRHAAYQEQNFSRFPLLTWNWRVPAYAAAALVVVATGIFFQRQADLATQTAMERKTITIPARSVQQPATLAAGTMLTASARSNQTPIKNYVMQKIPMQELLRVNRQNPGYRQATLDQNHKDSAQVRERASRMPITDLQPVNASIHF